MRNLVERIYFRTGKLGPLKAAGFTSLLLLAALDLGSQWRMSFLPFYLLVCAFLGALAGKKWALFGAFLSSGVLILQDVWDWEGATKWPPLAWNNITRLGFLTLVGWVAAEVVRLGSEKNMELQEKTRQLEAEIEENKLISSALVDTKEQLSHILRYSSAVAYSCKPVSPFDTAYISENTREILGYQAEEFITIPGFWMSKVHPDDLPLIETGTAQLLETGIQALEYRFLHKQGHYIWLLDKARVVPDARGTPVDVVGAVLDITNRKRMEEKLREVEARHREMLANIPVGTWMSNADSSYFYLSESVERLLGYPASRFSQNPAQAWLEIVHPEDREHVRLEHQKLRHSGRLDFEYRVIAKDGRVVWLNDRSSAVMEGNELYFYGMFLDITERKTARMVLQVQRDTAAALSVTSELTEAMERLLAIATRVDGIDCGGVYLCDHHGGFKLYAHTGLSPEFAEIVSYRPPNSAQAELVQKGIPAYTRHETLAKGSPAALREQIRALCVIPMKYEGKVIGCVNLASHARDELPAETRSAIESMVEQAAGALARIRSEKALKDNQALLSRIINAAPVIVMSANAEGYISLLEGQPLATLGIDPGKLVGHHFRKALAGYPAWVESAEGALSGKEFTGFLHLNSAILDCWCTPTRDPEGKPTGMVLVATNVTDRFLLEKQLLEIADREQARIGQDIHDGLCQALVGLAFDANRLQQVLSVQKHEEVMLARRIANDLDAAISQARQLSRGLFPIKLDAQGLPSALEELCRTTSERYQLFCQFVPPGGAIRVDKRTATHLFRIAQEAVTNALKHSRATSLRIKLRYDPLQVVLEIIDNGVGLGASSRPSSGIGISLMEYRARSIGGRLSISSGPGSGTLVSCCVPARTS